VWNLWPAPSNQTTVVTTSTTTPVEAAVAIGDAYCRGMADGVKAQLAYAAGRNAFLRALGFDLNNLPEDLDAQIKALPEGDKAMAQAAAERAGGEMFAKISEGDSPQAWCIGYINWMDHWGYKRFDSKETTPGGGGEPPSTR
jgi:hypothetical protein